LEFQGTTVQPLAALRRGPCRGGRWRTSRRRPKHRAKHRQFAERGGSGASLATLHTKAFIVDDRELFIGSFNRDPRSVNINTELGVIIESPDLGHEVLSQLQSQLDQRTYKVVLNEQDRLRWVDNEGAEPVMYDREPDTSWWRRTKVALGPNRILRHSSPGGCPCLARSKIKWWIARTRSALSRRATATRCRLRTQARAQ
jgi:phosphatidylserine/phosphatidylglycerophosphate/cardiolipin synthase-like enzyme